MVKNKPVKILDNLIKSNIAKMSDKFSTIEHAKMFENYIKSESFEVCNTLLIKMSIKINENYIITASQDL